jgi:hypothetical protein
MALLPRPSWVLTAAFSRFTPMSTDWPNVSVPSCPVTGQNCSGVNTPFGMAPGKSGWMKSLLMFWMYLSAGIGLLVPPMISAVVAAAIACPPVPDVPSSDCIGALTAPAAFDMPSFSRLRFAASACA